MGCPRRGPGLSSALTHSGARAGPYLSRASASSSGGVWGLSSRSPPCSPPRAACRGRERQGASRPRSRRGHTALARALSVRLEESRAGHHRPTPSGFWSLWVLWGKAQACPPADLGPNCPPLLTFRSEPRRPGTRPPPLLASGSLSSPRPPPPRSPLSEARRLRVLPRWSDARPSPRRPLAQEPASGMPSSPATPPLLLLSPARPPLSRPLHPYTRRTHAESAHSLPPAATANGPCHLPAIVSASITPHRPLPPPVCQMLRACRGQSEPPAPQPPELSRRGADQLRLGAELSNAVAEPRGRRRCPAWVGGAVSGGRPVS